MTGFQGSFYYQVAHKMLNVTNTSFKSFVNAIVPKLKHIPEEILNNMYSDRNIGFIRYYFNC